MQRYFWQNINVFLWLAFWPACAVFAQDSPPETYSRERDLVTFENNQTLQFNQARQVWQNRLVQNHFHQGQSAENPRIIFTAGAFGAGKTRTLKFLEQGGYFDSQRFVMIDPDEIRTQIPEYAALLEKSPKEAAMAVQPEAAFIANLVLERALAEHRNIILDSSFRHTDYFQAFLERLEKTHPEYSREIVHIEADPENILKRFQNRALTDGRDASLELVRETITQSENSVAVLAPKADQVLTVENNSEPLIVAISRHSVLQKLDAPIAITHTPPQGLAHLVPAPAATDDPNLIHIVFDLDWTVISEMQGLATAPPERIIVVDGKRYYVAEGIEDIVDKLRENPRVRISFFSGGDALRNIQVLKKIHLRDGSTLFDAAYRLFSKEDLVPPGMKGNQSEKSRKDLSLISRYLHNTILVDDVPTYALQDQHTLWLGRTFSPYTSFADAERAAQVVDADHRYIPNTYEIWLRDRLKLYRAFGVLDHALQSLGANGSDFAAAVEKSNHELADGDSAENHAWRVLGFIAANFNCAAHFARFGFISAVNPPRDF